MKLSVLYEDPYIIVINKPSGMLSIPAPGKKALTLVDRLQEYFQSNQILSKPHLCHRLDRDTSGVVIASKGKAVQKKMMAIFKARGVKKHYVAFIQGVPAKKNAHITNVIGGKSAQTCYTILGSTADFSVAYVQPVTGRKNQIRLHFKSIGHPVLGERRFVVAKRFPVNFRRLALHAYSVSFAHPVTNDLCVIKALLPLDMSSVLKKGGIKIPHI